jgi:hypothetical protein
VSYRLWWRWNDGVSGHVWLSADDLRRLTQEMLAQGMPWPGERLAASAGGREVVVTPQELEVALESSSAEPIALSDASLWRDWLAFLRGAVHNGGILIRA